MTRIVPTTLAAWAVAALGSGCSEAPARLELQGVDGRPHAPIPGPDGAPAVAFFVTVDCPIANAYAPEIAAIAAAYAPHGVRFFVVHVDPAVSAEQARAHAATYALPGPLLLDPQHRLVRRAGVTTTPEAALWTAGGRLVYRGRIDDRYPDLATRRAEPGERALRAALDAVLAGEPVTVAQRPAVGCALPDPSERG